VIGASFLSPDEVRELTVRARDLSAKPIGINLLLHATEERVDEVLELALEVLSTAWPRDNQDLAAIFTKAHDRGIVVMHMVPRVEDSVRAAEAGADVIVAQANESGGHVGEIGTTVIVRQVVKAVSPPYSLRVASPTAPGSPRHSPSVPTACCSARGSSRQTKLHCRTPTSRRWLRAPVMTPSLRPSATR
jgi:hypothetical protein